MISSFDSALFLAMRQAPMTAASSPSGDVSTGMSWLINFSEYCLMDS